MPIKHELPHRLIEIGIAIVVLVISLLIVKIYPDWRDEVLFGLIGIFLPIIVVEVMNLHTSINELKESNTQLQTALSESIERSLPELALLTKYASADIPVADMPRVWSELSWLIQKSYMATNWINPQNIYEKPWGSSALAVQRVKAQCKSAVIKKILIVDDEKELKSPKLKEELEEQLKASIGIHYMEHKKLKTELPLQSFSQLQIDFGIFDDRYLLLWLVDHKRQLTGGKLIVGGGVIREYTDYFDELLKNSTAYGKNP